MNVLHLVESLERGGLERVVVDLALAQKAAGHEVAVCCLFRKGQLAQELTINGVDVSCADKKPGLDTQAIRRVYREIRRTNAAVLHSHNAVANYYGALAALPRPRVRLVNTRHGMGSAQAGSVKERLFRMSLLRTAAVAMVCERAKDHFIANGMVPRRLAHVVLNGIRVEKFTTGSRTFARRGACLRSVCAQDAFVVGTVGRLNWAKDQALLVNSFARLHEQLPLATLVIVGSGELRRGPGSADCRPRDRGHTCCSSAIAATCPSCCPAFDIFAATSVTEGYSIAFLEAAAAALPVVASDVGGNREIVQHGVTGLVVAERTRGSICCCVCDAGAGLRAARTNGDRRRARGRSSTPA